MTERLRRFSFAERATHWMAALSFLYAALTGLALWSQHLYWLSGVLGGGRRYAGGTRGAASSLPSSSA